MCQGFNVATSFLLVLAHLYYTEVADTTADTASIQRVLKLAH
jgi:hypothetical protein